MTSATGTIARLLRLGALALPLLGVQPVLAQPAPNPQMAAAQTSFEALPEAERKAIQMDLIWTGHFNGAVSGAFGPLTFRAINALKGGGASDGLLSPAERAGLGRAAQAARDAAGFRLLTDEKTGIRIGIPTRILPRRDVTPAGGSRWQSQDEKVTLDTSATPPGETLEAIFEKATAANPNNPGRKITYKLLRPDFFVITGETPTGRFYRRLAAGPGGLRGFSIGYDKALAATVDKLVIAIAASFEPFPTGPAPAAGAVAGQSTPATPPLVAPARTGERYGVAVAVSQTLAVTSLAAVDGCRALRTGERPARVKLRDEASGLALLDIEGGTATAGLRGEAPAQGESVMLLAFGDGGPARAPVAIPGAVQTAAGKPAVLAPLQPGQSGSPLFDRQGRLIGLVTANPSDKLLVAGVAPQRSHAIAGPSALAELAAKAGIPAPQAAGGSDLSTGQLVEKAGKAVLPLTCAI